MADILNQALKDANYGVSGKNANPAVYYKITSYSMTRPNPTADSIQYSITIDAYMSKGGFMSASSDMTLTLSMYAGANKEYTICSAKTIKSTSDSWRSSSDTSPVKSGITVSGTFTAANLSGDVPVWFITERPNGSTIGSGEVTNSSYTMNFPAKQSDIYTVSYDANGGTGAPPQQNFVYNSGTPISTQVPTRTGYTFVNWLFTHNNNNFYFQPGDPIPNGYGNFTLVAQWTINQYTVTYDANGGTGAPSSQQFTFGQDSILSTQVPTKSGYMFVGWQDHNDYVLNGTSWHWYTFDAPYYANGYNDILSTFGYDKYSLINHWMNTTLLGSESRTSSQKFNIAQYMNLYPALGSDKKACAIHWNDQGYNEGRYGINNPIIDNNDVYPSGATVKNLAESNGATVILVAKWEPLPYSVNINNTWVPCTIKVNVVGEGYVYVGESDDYQDISDFNQSMYEQYGIGCQGNEDIFYATRADIPGIPFTDIADAIVWGQEAYDYGSGYSLYMKSDNVKQWVNCTI